MYLVACLLFLFGCNTVFEDTLTYPPPHKCLNLESNHISFLPRPQSIPCVENLRPLITTQSIPRQSVPNFCLSFHSERGFNFIPLFLFRCIPWAHYFILQLFIMPTLYSCTTRLIHQYPCMSTISLQPFPFNTINLSSSKFRSFHFFKKRQSFVF